jgi:hypothetical protein
MQNGSAEQRVIALVRQVDKQRQELLRERQKYSALKMQVQKLKLALAFERGIRLERDKAERREYDAKEAFERQQRQSA